MKTLRRRFHPFVAAFTAALLLVPSVEAQRISGSADLRIALKKLRVLGAALYVAAHPDDENTSVLATLARGRMLRTAYLSMTRGEGGQNLIGPEQGEALGIIRTQELLAARRIDGAEQLFTRALDFGYSKTAEETIRIWGREQTVGDIVWVIRTFRPDVIMTRFADTLGGHGNHTASAILTREAFHAAGDPTRYPDQLRFVAPWQPKRLVFNVFRFRGMGVDPSTEAVTLDVGMYSPLLGESFTEIAGRSRTMHKSQGFGASQSRGSQLQYFEPVAGEPARDDLFDGVDVTWSRIPGGAEIGAILREAEEAYDPEDPTQSVPALLRAYRAMSALLHDPWVRVKREELVRALLACHGIWLDALSRTASASPGETVQLTLTALNRSRESVVLESVVVPPGRDSSVQKSLIENTPFEIPTTIRLPSTIPASQPHWLIREPSEGSYRIDDQELVAIAENPPALRYGFTLRFGSEAVTAEVPVRFRWVDPVDGEQYRSFVIVPPVALNLPERTVVFPDAKGREVRVVVRGSNQSRSGRVRLELPPGWSATPGSRSFSLGGNGDEVQLSFHVMPGPNAESGTFAAVADVAGEPIALGRAEIRYPHIPVQTYFPPATGRLVRVELKRASQSIGYIAGAGDEIPGALQQIGYSVTMLSDADIEAADLSAFDAIVAGVRAYNTRPKLRSHQRRLMDYVFNGGRYVVQYVTQQRLESENLGPYPFTVSRERVTDEAAPVVLERPNHSLLTWPNVITGRDFDGWVQERGLYFAGTWDSKYETVFGSADPGEPLRTGGLLFARYGRGSYIYTGYSFFRQLPAGVAGAYRLFVNLLSTPPPGSR